MAIKNFWSMEPGEAIFAEELQKRYKNKIDLYFPVKDTGTDLLAISARGKTIAFQVKESRYYEKEDHTWHQETKKRIKHNKDKVDFYIFLFYWPSHLDGYQEKKQKRNEFEKHYLIVPVDKLSSNIKYKYPDKNGKYSFYFSLQEEKTKVIDTREPKQREKKPSAFDYTQYMNGRGWSLIDKLI